jgi:tryptophan synthase alpha chain
MLEEYVRKRREERDILLMTHLVLGYPSFEACRGLIASMIDAGVELIELQIPFSEPMADGPTILRANQQALARGVRVEQCLDFAHELTAEFEIPFLFMTYYNIPLQHGLERFAQRMHAGGVVGSIVPDLPPEEGERYLSALAEHALAPIFIFSPNTSDARLQYLARHAQGFVYCVARKGVTGAETEFAESLERYLARCRAATTLPLAVGFGVREKRDVDFLRGKADIAVVGTQTLRVIDERGVDAVGPFIRSLR